MKERLDVILVNQGHAPSREKAKAIIMSGNVYVNGQQIDEPYLDQKSFGEPDIDFPYQVPDERIFVLGDNRSVSIDSRHYAVGCVTSEQIVGKIVFRIWPLNRIGPVH